ncbi:MAG TPA: carboxypeptidase M32 [Gaiellaceae bacterium]|nr:carboxypeptidase M32 [Gaiellaceae bacterium]
MDAALGELKRLLGELTDLRRIESVLVWDMTVWMPPKGQAQRAVQLETLERLLHERQTDDRIGELLDRLEPYADSLPPDHDDACLVRVCRRDWEKARRIPAELAAELALTGARSYEAWVAAREQSDFASFRPWLERMLELRLRQVECFAPYDDPYDVLLDDYEPGLRTQEVREVFAVLAPELRDLVAEHADGEEDAFLRGRFPVAAQERLSREIVERFGVTWDSFRLDTTVHPFETTFGLGDIRLTTRYSEDDLSSLFTAMHECGHGLYEAGVSPALERTPLCSGASMALHESQSRLWENLVGRSLPFWRWFYPRVQEAFPEQLGHVTLERFHAAVNRARRSLVRVDADETTYGLHVLLRFELEQQLVSGRLAVGDLPEAWNARFEELMGIPVPNDALGVLQDSHWSAGSFGYFPTYLLGSVLAVQIFERAKEALPDLEEQIERGELSELHAWLREHLYVFGRKLTPAETIERVAGGPIDPQPYLRYLRDKLETLAAAV